MQRIYHVSRIGTREVEIKRAETEILAAYACGWDPAWCAVIDITDEVGRLLESGELAIILNGEQGRTMGEKVGHVKNLLAEFTPRLSHVSY